VDLPLATDDEAADLNSDEDQARFAPYLAGTVQEAWARCLPLWSDRGRVNDFPRAIRFTRYSPSFETLLGRSFAERFADDYPFLLERVRSDSEFETLCAFEILDFLSQHLWETQSDLPDCLRNCALPLPEQIRREVAADRIYRDHGLDTIGKLLSFEHNGQAPDGA
jgi:hypothetical protein